MISPLIIDPEFESKIPPLTDDEFQQLEENILADSGVINPLIIWNGILIDGHNRYRIIQKHPDLVYHTYTMTFSDRYEAIAWICKNQLGRRNLTVEQKRYLIGKQYEAEKMRPGSNNQYVQAKSEDDHRDHLHSGLVSERIAQEHNIGAATVRRAERYAANVDLADEALPGIKQEILLGQVKVTDKELSELFNASPEERTVIAEQLRRPKEERRKPSSKDPVIASIEEISNGMLSSQGDGGPEAMMYELRDAFEALAFRWDLCFEQYEKHIPDESCQKGLDDLFFEAAEYIAKKRKEVIIPTEEEK